MYTENQLYKAHYSIISNQVAKIKDIYLINIYAIFCLIRFRLDVSFLHIFKKNQYLDWKSRKTAVSEWKSGTVTAGPNINNAIVVPPINAAWYEFNLIYIILIVLLILHHMDYINYRSYFHHN